MLHFGFDAELAIIAKARQKAMGFYEHRKPDDLKGVNEYSDVSQLTLSQVGALHQYFVNQHAYVIQQAALTDTELTAAEYRRKSRKEMLLLAGSNVKGKKYLADALASQDAELSSAAQKALELQIQKKLMDTLAEGIKSKADLFSREISRRQMEHETTRR